MIERLPFLLWRAPAPCLTVLIYHRVLPKPDPLRPGEVHAALFDRQMRMLARCFCPMSLQAGVRALRGQRLTEHAVCVTFDDGYADNLTIAQPILKKHGIAATVFVATGYLDGGRMFNDAVIDGVASAGSDVLDLRERGMGLHQLRTVDERRHAIHSILESLKRLASTERDAAVQSVLHAARVRQLPAPPMLSSAQLTELARAGVDIGGHTVSHSILTSLSLDKAEDEIQSGRRALERIIDRPVSAFAYPNGRPGRDYGPEHPRLLERLGFDVAVSTAPGVATARNLAPLQVPRFAPWGHSTWALTARLARNTRSDSYATV